MAVYVDDFYVTGIGLGRMKMSHMIADKTEELLAMCDKIGVQKKWIQYAGTPREHFDIALGKRKLAIQNGAIEVGMRELAKMIDERGKKI
jgi:hypothetical protein